MTTLTWAFSKRSVRNSCSGARPLTPVVLPSCDDAYMNAAWLVPVISVVIGSLIPSLTEWMRSLSLRSGRARDKQDRLQADLVGQCIGAIGFTARGVDAIERQKWQAFIGSMHASTESDDAHYQYLADQLLEVHVAAMMRYPRLKDRVLSEYLETAYNSSMAWLNARAGFPETRDQKPPRMAMDDLIWASQERLNTRRKIRR